MKYWDTEPVDLKLHPDSKYFICEYYPVPRSNKENFHKEIQRLVKIWVSTTVQQYQYGTPVFIISKK